MKTNIPVKGIKYGNVLVGVVLMFGVILANFFLAFAEDTSNTLPPIPAERSYVWYSGNRRQQIWRAEDEIAIFNKQNKYRAGSILEEVTKESA